MEGKGELHPKSPGISAQSPQEGRRGESCKTLSVPQVTESQAWDRGCHVLPETMGRARGVTSEASSLQTLESRETSDKPQLQGILQSNLVLRKMSRSWYRRKNRVTFPKRSRWKRNENYKGHRAIHDIIGTIGEIGMGLCGLWGTCWVKASVLSSTVASCKRISLFTGNTNMRT